MGGDTSLIKVRPAFPGGAVKCGWVNAERRAEVLGIAGLLAASGS